MYLGLLVANPKATTEPTDCHAPPPKTVHLRESLFFVTWIQTLIRFRLDVNCLQSCTPITFVSNLSTFSAQLAIGRSWRRGPPQRWTRPPPRPGNTHRAGRGDQTHQGKSACWLGERIVRGKRKLGDNESAGRSAGGDQQRRTRRRPAHVAERENTLGARSPRGLRDGRRQVENPWKRSVAASWYAVANATGRMGVPTGMGIFPDFTFDYKAV